MQTKNIFHTVSGPQLPWQGNLKILKYLKIVLTVSSTWVHLFSMTDVTDQNTVRTSLLFERVRGGRSFTSYSDGFHVIPVSHPCWKIRRLDWLIISIFQHSPFVFCQLSSQLVSSTVSGLVVLHLLHVTWMHMQKSQTTLTQIQIKNNTYSTLTTTITTDIYSLLIMFCIKPESEFMRLFMYRQDLSIDFSNKQQGKMTQNDYSAFITTLKSRPVMLSVVQ